MGDQYDAPNQQVVRPDGSGPWEVGSGGSTRPEEEEDTGGTPAERASPEESGPPEEPKPRTEAPRKAGSREARPK